MPEWPPDYEAALRSTALADFPAGGRLLVSGKAPAQMLSGVVTGRMPSAPERVDEDLWMGRGSYSTILTSKGKMITDLRLFWLDPEEEAFLLDIPEAGLEATLAHFRRFLPPRLAQVKDVTGELPSITVVGPEAAALIARETCGLRVDTAQLDALEEDAFFLLGGEDEDRVRVTRCGQLSVPAFEVAARPGAMAALQALMLEGGARALSEVIWQTLRIEAGRPVYGTDMDENTIPIEAGIGDRAIDHTKGCYTGQEVIVRIRDRGKVNRHLCGFTWDEGANPRPGAELFGEVGEKPLGWITSAAFSPRFGGIALGYVRREVEPRTKLYLESSAGPALEVRSLDDEGWGSRAP